MPVLSEELQRNYDSISHPGAERAVLSIAIRNPETLFDVCTILEPNDFTNKNNKVIYEIMLSILDNKFENVVQVNPTIISSLAQGAGVLDDIGGLQYLDALYRTDAGEENLRFFTDKVKQASIRREAFLKAISVMEEAVNCEEEDTDEFVARQEEKFLDIVMRNNGEDDIIHVGSMVDIIIEEREKTPRDILGIPTGFAEYDRATGGLVPSRLKVWASPAKTGKSMMALNVAKNIAIDQRIPVFYADSEMKTAEQIDRLVSMVATEVSGIIVPETVVSRGLYAKNPKMREAVELAREIIKEAPFYHCYMAGISADKVYNMARKFQRQHGINWNGYDGQFVLIYDYIKMGDEFLKLNVNEYLALGQIADTLKNKIAGTLNIPTLAFAQLNPRTTYGSDDVNSSHLSGSSKITMFASEMAFLRRKTPEEINNDGAEGGNLVFKLGETRHHSAEYCGWLQSGVKIGVPSIKEIRNVSLDG